MQNEIYLDIRKIISLLVSDFPFTMPIIKFNIEFCEDKFAKNDGENIYINPHAWTRMDTCKKEGLLLHQWLHIAFFHVERGKNKIPGYWNDACDYLINNYIINYHSNDNIELPDHYIYNENYNDMSAEEIYYELLERNNNNDDFYRDLINNTNLFDELKQEIILAAELSKNFNKLPKYYERCVFDLVKSKTPWATILNSIIKEMIYSGGSRSYAKPKSWSWSYGFALPGQNNKKIPKIVVIYDTSGSMSNEHIKDINGELAIILNYVKEVTVITSDCKVHENIKIKNINEIIKQNKIKFIGGGKTNFQPALLAASEINPDIVIYFTDGIGKFGKKPMKLKNILWVINNNTIIPPFGRYIRII